MRWTASVASLPRRAATEASPRLAVTAASSRRLIATVAAFAVIATLTVGCAPPPQVSATWPRLESGKPAFYYFGASS